MAAFLFVLETGYSTEFDQFEFKCLWVVRNAITNPASIDEMLDFAADHGFNHLMVQVRGRGDALYKSNLVPRSELLAENDFDPLEYVIKNAHDKGIKVHAWVNVYFIWASDKNPKSSNHILNINPQWLDSNGKDTSQYLNNGNDVQHFYLAPHHPEVENHLLAVFRELTALYAMDGLHLDYVRFNDSEYGNNIEARTLFNQQKNDYQEENIQWDQFKSSSVTSLVKNTKLMLNDVRPDCILSAAVKPNLNSAKSRFSQEWDLWLASEYIDWVLPMNYAVNIRDFAENIDIIYKNLPEHLRHKIIMGIGIYNKDPLTAQDLIKYSLITRFKGFSLFSYNVFLENTNYINELK